MGYVVLAALVVFFVALSTLVMRRLRSDPLVCRACALEKAGYRIVQLSDFAGNVKFGRCPLCGCRALLSYRKRK